jgi:prepilin-type N-terminal cleavage/methylation domain-containing protein
VVPIEMIHVSNRIRFRSALTLLEMIIAMAIMAIVFAVLVPQLKAIQNSWDTKAGKAEALQNGRILLDHLQRTLASARQISAVSSLDETDGFIQLSDNESNTYRYDVVGTTTKYIKYGPIGQLADLAGPISRFQVYCYDVNDMNAPLDPVQSPADVRFIKVEATLTNSASMGQDLTVTASAYLRTGAIGDEAVPVMLFVSGGQMNMGPSGDISVVPTAQERLKITLIQSWGYQVNLIHHQQAQADFDDAVADANVAYVPVSVSDTDLNTKLRYTPIGVVIEKMMTQFGIADGWIPKARDEIDIIDNSHYITSPFSTGLLTYLSSMQNVTILIFGQAPGLTTLANVNDVGIKWVPALAVIDIGGELVGGDTAAGRRVQLPWGGSDFSFNTLNNDGKTIMKRAIEWAAAVKGVSGEEPGPGEGTYRDEFNSSAYSGNDGTLNWSGDWQEINESDGPVRGDEVVTTDPLANPSSPSNQLRVRNSSEGVMREADLSGAVTATLSLQYRRENLDDAGDYVAVEVSTNGTLGPWIEIVRFAGPDNDAAYQPFSQDISAYIDANFAIRFISSLGLSNRDDVWFDDVEILLSQ